ncbi:MAG: JDVT-CTERM domain-containing protein [Desulfobacterium sp.]|nr:JDVT-CTERM domain-containing protein [Desulfobacterium sp.]
MKKSPNIASWLRMVPITCIVLGCMLLPMTNMASASAILKPALLAKAEPDECFNGVGGEYWSLDVNRPDYQQQVQDCIDNGNRPKVNQSYVWGLTNTEEYIWFGTGSNTLCFVNSAYHKLSNSMENKSWVCELNESQYPAYMAKLTGEDSYLSIGENGLGDWRVSKIYRYSKASGVNEDITPDLNQDPSGKILSTLGIRSAGTLDGVVFFAGPGFANGNFVVNMFAYKNDANHTYLGSHSFTEYSNIRKWIVAGNDLYTAVGDQNGAGNVLKWVGDADDPFQFVEVGKLPGSGAELAYHEGRLFITTWPGSETTYIPSSVGGLYMSPVVKNGLPESNEMWKKVWSVSEYEPDPVVASTYGGGAIKSFDGHLYWGTMHVPVVALQKALEIYGIDTNKDGALQDVELGAHRAISIFRASNISENGDASVELLYGESKLPVYTPDEQRFKEVPNKMGVTPLWGKSGFGNPFNNYTWTMEVFKGKLYIGTMDWSYLLSEMYGNLPYGLSFSELMANDQNHGADLWRIDGSNKMAVAEDIEGIGNYANYGIRTMVSDVDHLYLGTANPMNLMTDLTKNEPEGGWELIQMDEKVKSGGGGCTYNSDLKSLDFMFFVLLALALLYPWRRKIFK